MKECGWKFDLKNLQYPVNFPPLPTISPTQNHAYTSAANTALAPTVRMSISPARARLAAARTVSISAVALSIAPGTRAKFVYTNSRPKRFARASSFTTYSAFAAMVRSYARVTGGAIASYASLARPRIERATSSAARETRFASDMTNARLDASLSRARIASSRRRGVEIDPWVDGWWRV
jgi:hypothetical protein|tara:strand:- start:37 stop:573 length:537 start_codon:yes stop_codon:yes gene_type:complete